MRANRSKDTKPEVMLRKALWAAGVRGFRKNDAKLPGKPDLYFPKAKLCVFVHGCFWHGCPHCSRNLVPSANAGYWRQKVRLNQRRDALVASQLEAIGCSWLVIWECQMAASLNVAVHEISTLVRDHR